MQLMQKIEEIRNKPEHIRMRYVWASVLVSMIFIIIIWIFSMLTLFNKDSSQNPDLTPIKDQLQNFKKEAPSLKDITGGISNINQEGVASQQENQQPTTNDNQ